MTTTVPADRSASLRMPIQWLCDGTAQTVTETGLHGETVDRLQSTCPDGNTCIAGTCTPSMVPVQMLPDYKPQSVFGGATEAASGTCFDTVACMAGGMVVDPDRADCTIAKPTGVDGLNVALRVAADGICDDTGTTCFVPIDGNSGEGWSLTPAGDRIILPPAVCSKLKQGTASALYVSTSCSTKTEAIPPCGPWSAVLRKCPGAHLEAGTPPPPTAHLLGTLRPDGGGGLPCCPLMIDGANLFTCVCPSAENATLVSIGLPAFSVAPALTLAEPASRQNSTSRRPSKMARCSRSTPWPIPLRGRRATRCGCLRSAGGQRRNHRSHTAARR